MAVNKAKKNKGGRPRVKKNYSQAVKDRYIAAAKELAKEKGCTLEYQLLSMIYADNIQDSVKASIMKSYNDAMIVRESEQHITKEDKTPQIFLPELDEDQSLTMIKGGKKK